ncbi:hypothetical protein SAMN05216412_10726 [Nitrosospira multiformis]|uniref:Uncharacterized protein n=1 Tax=Nitrosospira multiformis TaxID=1231 RepID=A0A1I0EPC8_9PROT|nr:hypothetical protein SAMN05216412_10726 [Nitrosospira multiformis]
MQIDPTSAAAGCDSRNLFGTVLVHYPQQLAPSGKRAAMNMWLGFMKIVLLHDFYW